MIYVLLINVLKLINSYIYTYSYNTIETYELNGWEQYFTVIDYEVYSVEF